MNETYLKKGHFSMTRIAVGATALIVSGAIALPAFAQDAGVSATATVQATTTPPPPPPSTAGRFPNLHNIVERPPVRFPASTTLEHREASTTMRVEMHASTTVARQDARQADLITKAKAVGDTELNNRVKSLTALLAKVQAMVHVSDASKAAIAASINADISTLTTLKAQIDADTSTTTLKTDVGSVTKDYRVYALVEPQIAILAAADRASSIADSITALGTKLSTRIATSTNASALTTLLADLNAKAADAKVQSSAAVTETASLTPDNGDATIAASNNAALKDARSKIQTAQKDLIQAQQDANKIVQGLRGTTHVKVTAQTGTSAGAGTQQ